MGIKILRQDQVTASTVTALGFDASSVDLDTPEALAALIRRAASFLCPVTPRALVQSVEESLAGLVSEMYTVDGESAVRVMLEDLVGYGDLVEVPVDDANSLKPHRMIFLAQPMYIMLSETTCLLAGMRADGLPLVDGSLHDRISYYNHARRMTFEPSEDPEELLGILGIRKVAEDQWLNCPQPTVSTNLIQIYEMHLAATGPPGSIAEIQILDSNRPARYYRGRWHSPTAHDAGLFVGRRPLIYGADQWCYCELAEGNVVKLIDLPALHRLDRGCDEAWRLQAAIDACSGTPQVVRVVPSRIDDEVVLQFNSPIPSWAQRRLDALGQPLGHQRGSLFSYRIPGSLVDQELEFLKEMMWLERKDEIK